MARFDPAQRWQERERERRRGVGQCFSLIGLTGLFAERKTKLNKGAYPREEIERLSIYNQTRLSDQTWWRVASAFLGTVTMVKISSPSI